MGRRADISSILLIGSGPIVIGQASEFDYSGTQATRVLRGEGYRVVLVNSNPATIMTDPEFADATYLEPLTAEVVESVIASLGRAEAAALHIEIHGQHREPGLGHLAGHRALPDQFIEGQIPPVQAGVGWVAEALPRRADRLVGLLGIAGLGGELAG